MDAIWGVKFWNMTKFGGEFALASPTPNSEGTLPPWILPMMTNLSNLTDRRRRRNKKVTALWLCPRKHCIVSTNPVYYTAVVCRFIHSSEFFWVTVSRVCVNSICSLTVTHPCLLSCPPCTAVGFMRRRETMVLRRYWSADNWLTTDFITARRYASAIHAVVVYLHVCPLSVCLSQVGVLQRRLNLGSHKQRHTIARGL